MISLFNPYVLLSIVLAIVGSFGSGYYKGGYDEEVKQQVQVAKLNDEARQREKVLVTAVNTQAIQLMKADQNAKLLQQKRDADIDSGALKLRIPVKTVCPLPTPADTPSAVGSDVGTTSAELDSTAAKSLVALTDEGDAAIRKLNTCIALYNEAYQTLKGKP